MRSSRLFHFVAAIISWGSLVNPGYTAIIVDFISPDDPQWQTTYNQFQFRDSFEQTSFAIPGMSIELFQSSSSQPSYFNPSQTYTSLPRLYNPSIAGVHSGAFPQNAWNGQHMVTNFSFDPTAVSGQNWTNAWDHDHPARRLTFKFSEPMSKFGVGMSNLQDLYRPHALFVNNSRIFTSIEDEAASRFIHSEHGFERNTYMVVSATGGDQIFSVGIDARDSDGMNFDVVGVNAVPEPGTCSMLGLLSVFGLARIRRNAIWEIILQKGR